MKKGRATAPDALLLIAPGCVHCPVVLEGLRELVKQGILGRLEVVNVAEHPEVAETVGSRTVPWTRIGPFELIGLQSRSELTRWANCAAGDAGAGKCYSQMLLSSQLPEAIESIRAHPEHLPELVGLLSQEDTPMVVRIGIGAILEDLQGSGLLDPLVPLLIELTGSDSAPTRADACHYLGLSGNRGAIEAVAHLLNDESADVREIAMETLSTLDTGA
jgi:hypothetical protein